MNSMWKQLAPGSKPMKMTKSAFCFQIKKGFSFSGKNYITRTLRDSKFLHLHQIWKGITGHPGAEAKDSFSLLPSQQNPPSLPNVLLTLLPKCVLKSLTSVHLIHSSGYYHLAQAMH